MNTKMEVFLELHAGLDKQGVGSSESTKRALEMIPELPERPRILDIGCGPGRQTLDLARFTDGTITAIDVMPEYLDQLRRRAEQEGCGDRIQTLEKSMGALEFADAKFDLIWSEGAIYNIGFAAGLAVWRKFLRPGGSTAVSELTWLTDSPPDEVGEFFNTAYPPMARLEENRAMVMEAGYELLGDFVMPDADWWDGYYDVLEPRIATLREKYASADRSADDVVEGRAHQGAAVEGTPIEQALEVLDESQREIDMFRARQDSYGYVFYIMRLDRSHGRSLPT